MARRWDRASKSDTSRNLQARGEDVTVMRDEVDEDEAAAVDETIFDEDAVQPDAEDAASAE